MFIRQAAIVTALAAFSLLALTASASASTAIRTDPGGALLTGSTTLTNTSSTPFVWTMTGLGSITCNQSSFDADLFTNTSPTGVIVRLTALTFTSCTDTIPVLTFTGCHLHGALPRINVTGTSSVSGTVTITDLLLRCGISGADPNACFYTAASAVGTYASVPSTLAFTNVSISPVTTSGSLGSICGTSASASWTFTHLVQGGTNRTVTVTT